MLDARSIVGVHHILFITLDSLRFDVARDMGGAGRTPNLARVLPGGVWEERSSPGIFTFPAHQAFFAGFLPTPRGAERALRLFACRSERGTTIGDHTFVFDAPNIVTGLAELGYHTVCIGGVGFFSKRTPLGSVLPGLFNESHWAPEFSTDDLDSAKHQVDLALALLAGRKDRARTFLFINMPATHVPHSGYLPGEVDDSSSSQGAALAYIDLHLGRLFAGLREHGSWLSVICSDHGDAFGEDGYHGHSVPHQVVWSVPYAEFVLSPDAS